MRLLSSEQKKHIEEAVELFEKTGKLNIDETCDCGSHIRHNNGGNYHDFIRLRRDGDKIFIKYDTTCELVAPAEWNPCDDWKTVIRKNADWL